MSFTVLSFINASIALCVCIDGSLGPYALGFSIAMIGTKILIVMLMNFYVAHLDFVNDLKMMNKLNSAAQPGSTTEIVR